ncbi:MAG: hypothetical protein LBD87_02405 [Prevotellaceae bacterium]|jgi:hypothetical protein|nr:hypothetical protein [Prevotellaceae bacterium]
MPKSKTNRKRAKKSYRPSQPKNYFKQRPPQAHLRRMEEVGRKLLRIVGVDDSFLDRMTKQQLHAILTHPCEKPHVVIKKGERVPRSFLRYVRSSLFASLEIHTLDNDAGVDLSLADALSYGFAFFDGMTLYPGWKHIVLGEVEAVKAALKALNDAEIFLRRTQDQVICLIRMPLMNISQVQFRLYGCLGNYEMRPSGAIGLTIALTSAVPECISFQHFDIWRKAYRFCIGPIQMLEMLPAKIRYSAIFPTCREEDDRELSIYIQQHAILRLKERLQILPPTERMMLLYSSLMLSPIITPGPDDQPLFVAHIDNNKNVKKEKFGYFSFVIQGDKLFILTFLPITSALTPEGKRLQKRLHLSTKDITYLGMDSLNFLFDIDFEQIPLLKEALVQSGIYEAKKHLQRWLSLPDTINDKQTAFIKKYLEEHPANCPDTPELPDDDDFNEPANLPTGENT